MAGSKANARVVIVGAGPVGMVCALALNRSGISVTVFEQEPSPPGGQRAAAIPPANREIRDEIGGTQKKN
jgi:3-(3-hydroxy-phenyl)propionate hydroxylase